MLQNWQLFLTHTIWHSQHNAGGWFDAIYPAFNLLEALCWFGVAIYVLRRSWRNGGASLEATYACFWVVFGLTDLREAYAQQVGLILFKGIVLAALIVMRRKVLLRYPGVKAV